MTTKCFAFRAVYRNFAVVNYAIIAAGEGSRLRAEGVSVPKPLVQVGGECLVDRLARVFGAHDARRIAIVCNDLYPETARHLQQLRAEGAPLDIVVKTTPSSLHSLVALAPYVADDTVCVTTVDTLFREDEFGGYVDALRRAVAEGWDGVMGVTAYVDDERPLYVDVDDDGRITAFLDHRQTGCRYVSAGIYGLTPRCLAVAARCVAEGTQRMRNFQRALLTEGLRLQAYALTHVFDIDHVADIAAADRWLACGEGQESDVPEGTTAATRHEHE